MSDIKPCLTCGNVEWLDPQAELADFREFLANTLEATIQNATKRHNGCFKSDDLADAIIANLPWRKKPGTWQDAPDCGYWWIQYPPNNMTISIIYDSYGDGLYLEDGQPLREFMKRHPDAKYQRAHVPSPPEDKP